jgi:hypothetical protein
MKIHALFHHESVSTSDQLHLIPAGHETSNPIVPVQASGSREKHCGWWWARATETSRPDSSHSVQTKILCFSKRLLLPDELFPTPIQNENFTLSLAYSPPLRYLRGIQKWDIRGYPGPG